MLNLKDFRHLSDLFPSIGLDKECDAMAADRTSTRGRVMFLPDNTISNLEILPDGKTKVLLYILVV